MQTLKVPEYLDILMFFSDGDAVLVGLGHDPEQAQTVRAKMCTLSSTFQACTWVTIPIMQTGPAAYVEYYLFGRSKSWLGGQGAPWVGASVCPPREAGAPHEVRRTWRPAITV